MFLQNQWIKLPDIPNRNNNNQRKFYLDYYIHQITYLKKHNISNSLLTIPWELDSCVITNENGFALSICKTFIQHNYICQYDYTKHMTVSGTHCTACGTSKLFNLFFLSSLLSIKKNKGSRVSGQPAAGSTCKTDFPLTNATLFPIQHEIKDAYQGGYLDLYIESFNLDNPEITFPDTSVIMGYKNAWNLWKNDFSSRLKTLSKNTKDDLNWKDLSLTNNWPINCDNNYCAATELLCNNPSLADINPPMNNKDIPSSLFPVPVDQAYKDSTCGPNIQLENYVKNTKRGPKQIQNSFNSYYL